jgi:uncharacterized protein YqfB (UPF0267 family)
LLVKEENISLEDLKKLIAEIENDKTDTKWTRFLNTS